MNGMIGTQIFKDFGNNQIYFKIKIENIEGENKSLRIEIHDISDIILGQQKLSDEMYRDVVLSNYSHEQLTPLNSFLNNSQILNSDLKDLKV